MVVDAPRLPLDVAAHLAKTSTSNFLVLQLNVKDVRAARSMIPVAWPNETPGAALKEIVTQGNWPW